VNIDVGLDRNSIGYNGNLIKPVFTGDFKLG
jgi:hypothetical protein